MVIRVMGVMCNGIFGKYAFRPARLRYGASCDVDGVRGGARGDRRGTGGQEGMRG